MFLSHAVDIMFILEMFDKRRSLQTLISTKRTLTLGMFGRRLKRLCLMNVSHVTIQVTCIGVNFATDNTLMGSSFCCLYDCHCRSFDQIDFLKVLDLNLNRSRRGQSYQKSLDCSHVWDRVSSTLVLLSSLCFLSGLKSKPDFMLHLSVLFLLAFPTNTNLSLEEKSLKMTFTFS